MASTNFKLFDENKQNMMSDQEYNTNTARLGGVQAGIASSALHNKSMYQQSLMVNAIAQFMVSKGFDASDTAAVSTFNSNLAQALEKMVSDETASDILDLNNKYNSLQSTINIINSSINYLSTVANGTLEFIGKIVGLVANTRNVIQVPSISKYRLLFVYIEDTKVKQRSSGGVGVEYETYFGMNSSGSGHPQPGQYASVITPDNYDYNLVSVNCLYVINGIYDATRFSFANVLLYNKGMLTGVAAPSGSQQLDYNTITNVYAYPEYGGGSMLVWGLKQNT